MKAQCAIVVCLLAAAGCGASSDAARFSDVPADATADRGVEYRVDGRPVAATLKLARGRLKPGETVELSVELDVAPLWEIRSLDAEPQSTATRLALDLPRGLRAEGDWRAPQTGRSLSPDGHAAYAGEVVFTRTLVVTEDARAGRHDVKCQVGYQACNEQTCLRPMVVELAATLRVE